MFQGPDFSKLKQEASVAVEAMYAFMPILREREELFNMVSMHMKWEEDKVELWFRTDNPGFGGFSPDLLLVCGRGAKVAQFIKNAVNGDF